MPTKPTINNGLNLDLERAQQDGTEYQFGALSQPGIVSIPLDERDQYLPQGETQFDSFGDFQDCATRSPLNHLEALFTYHYQHNMLPENKTWMEQEGYVTNSKVTFSDRFIAKLSNTTHTGNSLKAPLDAIHNLGLIPKKLLPKTDSMTWDEYYAEIPQSLKDLGTEFVNRFTIVYEQVQRIHMADVLKDDMIGVAGFAWPIPDTNDVYHSDNSQFNHAFLLYNLPAFQAFDNYTENNDPNDYTKSLAPDYLLYDYGYRVILAAEKKSTDDLQTESLLQQLSTILKQLSDWLFMQKPLPVPPTPVPPNNLLNTMCLAIQAHEGWKLNPPSRSVKNHNPGNCKFSTIGYLPIYEPVGKDAQNFAVFKDYATGFLYLKNLIKSKIASNPSQNLYQFFAIYAPDSDGNDSKNYAEVVATALKVIPQTFKLGALLTIGSRLM